MKPKINATEVAEQARQEELPIEEETVSGGAETFQDSNDFTSLLMELDAYGIDESKFMSLKDRYGNLYVSTIHDGGQIFLWKKLSRAEYKQIVESGAMAKDMSYQDAVLRKCMLGPKADHAFLAASDAGVVPTLFSQIMYQSGFVPEHVALSNIVEI